MEGRMTSNIIEVNINERHHRNGIDMLRSKKIKKKIELRNDRCYLLSYSIQERKKNKESFKIISWIAKSCVLNFFLCIILIIRVWTQIETICTLSLFNVVRQLNEVDYFKLVFGGLAINGETYCKQLEPILLVGIFTIEKNLKINPKLNPFNFNLQFNLKLTCTFPFLDSFSTFPFPTGLVGEESRKS
ncbi:hypothetical protein BpHYR1_045773 [Brachionus plicatilis]|uniref:Uncharacterized protein n=1 Tax=Brachionus plicatilis TaxID=10195 RepID=A0A3M7RDH3_BRAPC|nr:hypothetical protein BpHYR1_045773 [Brachionus plicatilis]